MQVSSPSSQAVLQKFGFLIMAPIAVIMHGVFLLIPFSQEQKAKEPEKKEEILSIGSIAALPAGQIPPTATSASPTPKPSASAAPIVQPQQNPVPVPIVQPQTAQQPARTPDNSSEVQQLQKKLEDLQNKVQQQTAKPTQPEQPAPVAPPVSIRTSGDLLAKLKSTPCQGGNTTCRAVQYSKAVLLEKLVGALGPYDELVDNEDQFTCYLFSKDEAREYLDIDVVGNGTAMVQQNQTCKSRSIRARTRIS